MNTDLRIELDGACIYTSLTGREAAAVLTAAMETGRVYADPMLEAEVIVIEQDTNGTHIFGNCQNIALQALLHIAAALPSLHQYN